MAIKYVEDAVAPVETVLNGSRVDVEKVARRRGPDRVYATAAERQKAYRARKKGKGDE